MIDLHLHLLPGIDDGSPNLDVTRAMLAAMAGMGFTHLVATPHLMQPLSLEYRNEVEKTLSDIRPLAQSFGITLGLGYEHMLEPGIVQRLKNGEPSTIAGTRALLVELPFVSWPHYTSTTLFQLRTAGFRPILAHPERYMEVQKNPAHAFDTGAQGVTLQLTQGSFDGVYGKNAARSARLLLSEAIKQDIPVILATDAHSEGQRLARVPAGLEWIRRNMADGERVVEWATVANPSLILHDEPTVGFAAWRRSLSTWSAEPPESESIVPARRNVLQKALRIGMRDRHA
jgi:protein-tyrosine phosphatase